MGGGAGPDITGEDGSGHICRSVHRWAGPGECWLVWVIPRYTCYHAAAFCLVPVPVPQSVPRFFVGIELVSFISQLDGVNVRWWCPCV